MVVMIQVVLVVMTPALMPVVISVLKAVMTSVQMAVIILVMTSVMRETPPLQLKVVSTIYPSPL